MTNVSGDGVNILLIQKWLDCREDAVLFGGHWVSRNSARFYMCSVGKINFDEILHIMAINNEKAKEPNYRIDTGLMSSRRAQATTLRELTNYDLNIDPLQFQFNKFSILFFNANSLMLQ